MLDWGLNDKQAGQGEGNKRNYTKFEEGITKIRLLLDKGDKPHMRWAHWMPQFSRKVTCPGRGCPIDEMIKTQKANKITPTYGNAKSYGFNIWNYATGQHEIMEEGITMVEALQDFLAETLSDKDFIDEHGTGIAVKDLIIKVRKKKNSSGRFNWTMTLDSVSALGEKEAEALANKHDIAELTKPPTIEQVRSLLMVEATGQKEYIEEFNRIMGYAKQEKDTSADDGNDEGLGVVVE